MDKHEPGHGENVTEGELSIADINAFICKPDLSDGDTAIFHIQSGPWDIFVCPVCMPLKLKEPLIANGLKDGSFKVTVEGHSKFVPGQRHCAVCEGDLTLGDIGMVKVRPELSPPEYMCPVCEKYDGFEALFKVRSQMDLTGKPRGHEHKMTLFCTSSINCLNPDCKYEGSQAAFEGKATVNSLSMVKWDKSGEYPVVSGYQTILEHVVEVPNDTQVRVESWEMVKCVKEALKKYGIFDTGMESHLAFNRARRITNKCIQILAPRTYLIHFELKNRYKDLFICKCGYISPLKGFCHACGQNNWMTYTGIQGNLFNPGGHYRLQKVQKTEWRHDEMPYTWIPDASFMDIGRADLQPAADVVDVINSALTFIKKANLEPLFAPWVRHLGEGCEQTIVFSDLGTALPLFAFSKTHCDSLRG